MLCRSDFANAGRAMRQRHSSKKNTINSYQSGADSEKKTRKKVKCA